MSALLPFLDSILDYIANDITCNSRMAMHLAFGIQQNKLLEFLPNTFCRSSVYVIVVCSM